MRPYDGENKFQFSIIVYSKTKGGIYATTANFNDFYDLGSSDR